MIATRTPRTKTRALVGGHRIARARTPRIVFAGGGTGGHLLPGIAAAQQVRALRPKARIHFAGTGRPLESMLVPSAGFELHELPAAPFRVGPRGLARFAWQTGRGWWRARTLLQRWSPDVVVGLGGYGMVAPVLAARRAGIPVVLLEQNAVPGLAVRALARFADRVLCHFPEAGNQLPEGTALTTGSPLRRSILEPEGASPFPSGTGPTLCVLGGSLGAQAINRGVMAALPALAAAWPDLRVLHLAGDDLAAATLRTGYATLGTNARVLPFCHDMGPVYRDADLVIARAGGMTVAELAATGTPALLVPLPGARQDHQRRNADALVREGAAHVCEQDVVDIALGPMLLALLDSPSRRRHMARNARALGRRDAAAAVADLLMAFVDAQGDA